MKLKKYLSVVLFLATFVTFSNAQERSRIVRTSESQPTTTTSSPDRVKKTVISSPTSNPNTRPILTNKIIVNQPQTTQAMINKTSSSLPTNTTNYSSSSRMAYSSGLTTLMLSSIRSKYGVPYRMGTAGPNRYDCSGFVWSVFNDAGFNFTRTSARTYWAQFEPVYGDDRFQFGTLVFFNKLGHVGIVADREGFYQASSSKGVTYSKFAGYWEKRIVGYRRVPMY